MLQRRWGGRLPFFFFSFFFFIFSRGGWYYTCEPPCSRWRCFELKVDHRREAPEHINQSRSLWVPCLLTTFCRLVSVLQNQDFSTRAKQCRKRLSGSFRRSCLQDWHTVIVVHGQTRALEISFTKREKKKSKISQK